MHVWKRLRIDLDRLPQAGGAVGPTVRDADRRVGKRPVGSEGVNPTFDVHLFCQVVCSANDLFVVHRKAPFSIGSVETPTSDLSSMHPRRHTSTTFLETLVALVLAGYTLAEQCLPAHSPP